MTQVLFSKPMPQLSCQLNAYVTALTCQWLMGECGVNDAEDTDGNLLKGQGVRIERCAYVIQLNLLLLSHPFTVY